MTMPAHCLFGGTCLQRAAIVIGKLRKCCFGIPHPFWVKLVRCCAWGFAGVRGLSPHSRRGGLVGGLWAARRPPAIGAFGAPQGCLSWRRALVSSSSQRLCGKCLSAAPRRRLAQSRTFLWDEVQQVRSAEAALVRAHLVDPTCLRGATGNS